MKLTAILILSACLQVSAKGNAQGISLSAKNTPLQKVFKEIQKQSGYNILYNMELIQKSGTVTFDVRNVTLQQALEICLKDKPFTYAIVDRTVVIKPKETEETSKKENATNVEKPLIDISGKITDPDNNPLAGATVKVKGTTKGTTTDNNGVFNLKGLNEDAVLEISYVGYQAITIPVNNRSSIVLSLKRSESKIDEVQIIAYGQTSKRFQTGNVATVKAEDIQKQPVNNPLLALEGRVPGLQIQQATGFAGSGVKVRIQGENSIAGGNDPLYVIDGVPYSSQLLPSISATQGSSGGRLINHSVSYGSPLSYINPADIESIEVLKDADATAIYGSQAANGAILITTKKGKVGDQRIEFNLQQGWGKVTRKLNLLNRRQYLDMRYEALKNDNIPLSSLDQNSNYDLTVWDTTHSTDWQKELIGNVAHYTDLQTTVSGGATNTNFLVGAGYHRETVVIPGDFNDQRASTHFQINSFSSNRRFKLNFTGSYMVDINKLPRSASSFDLTQLSMQLAPVAPALYNADGSLNWAYNASGVSTWDNPLASLLMKYTGRTNNLVSNALLSYQIIPGLSIKTSFGYSNLQVNETGTIPLASNNPRYRATRTRAGFYNNNSINSWIIEPQASYDKNLFGGKLEALVGTTIQQRNSREQSLTGTDYINDDVLEDIHAAGKLFSDPSIDFAYKYNAAFGRVNYAWNQKYILNLTARRDGSSRFGANNRFHNFGALGASWVFSQERFISDLLPFISFGKIKASYGTTGNDQIGEYQYLSLYNPLAVGNPYQGITTLHTNSLSNPYLQWEETRKAYVAINLGFWKDRLLIDAGYYRNRSSNQLLAYQLPITTGFNSIIENFPALVQNTGLEFVINSFNMESKKFKWSTVVNLTIPRNKLVSFPGIENTGYNNSLIVGAPTTIVKRFHLIGVDPATGIYYYDSKTSPFSPQFPQDSYVTINTSPSMYGGIENSFTYNSIQLDFLFQAVKQIAPNYFLGFFPGVSGINQPAYVLDRWVIPGNVASHQKFNSNNSLAGQFSTAYGSSDAIYSDASYIRLKNISLSWRLPDPSLRKIKIHGVRVYVLGQNLLTITNYKGLDPETASSTSLPPLRVLTLGTQITL